MEVKLANCNEMIDTDILITMRTKKENIIIDTSIGEQDRIEDFNQLMELLKSANIPDFVKEMLNSASFILECKLEKIRAKYYPGLPSRLSCVFFSVYPLVRAPYKHKIKSINHGKFYRFDMNFITAMREGRVCWDEEYFHRYWKGDSYDYKPSSWEYVFDGEIEIETKEG